MIAALALIILSYFLVPLLAPVLSGQSRKNYRGRFVPTGLGLAFILPAVTVMLSYHRSNEDSLFFAVLVLFFALLGLVDDCFGHSGKKGFRGHFKTEGLSTGGLKAVGGGAISLLIGFFYASSGWEGALNGLLIALSANFINLLDLQPGRAGKFSVVLGMLLFLGRPAPLQPLLWLQAATIGYLPWDLKGLVMMGDTGSNPLGAALGLALVLALPWFGRLLIVLALSALNLGAERCSFSAIIESNRFLRFLDQIGRRS
ncbi:MAG: hypothetical protein GX335_04565 [Firmicutes bacterium]|nr:hypothetical protein [Bacillota bacterium]